MLNLGPKFIFYGSAVTIRSSTRIQTTCKTPWGELTLQSEYKICGPDNFEIYSEPENLKKVQEKNSKNQINKNNFFREIAFLTVLNFFLVQKLIFGHFWNCKKWNLAKKFFSWNWIIWFHKFCFGLDSFFSGLLKQLHYI